VADDFEGGVTSLLQVTGLGEFQPNTVLLGWSDDAVKERMFHRTLRKVLQLKKNLLIYNETDMPLSAMGYFIDVWWLSRQSFNFMLTLAHLIKLNSRWSEHKIRVFRVIRDDSGRAEAKEGMTAALHRARIDAKVLVVTSSDPLVEVVGHSSRRSGIVFLGLPASEGDGLDLIKELGPTVEALQGHVFLCASWEELEL